MDNENSGNAIGSTEPTVEEQAHYTPEMQALADRDEYATPSGIVFVCDKHHTPDCGADGVIMTTSVPHKARMQWGYTGTGFFKDIQSGVS